MKISHTPDEPSVRMACRLPSQPLKSPMTRTDLALGAHTAKLTPLTSPSSLGKVFTCEPSASHSRSWRPSENR